MIGNKAVHENYVSKEDAWNQYNYMEDLLRIVADRHANRHKKRGPEIKKSQTGHYGTNVRKTYGAQTKARGQNQSLGRGLLCVGLLSVFASLSLSLTVAFRLNVLMFSFAALRLISFRKSGR